MAQLLCGIPIPAHQFFTFLLTELWFLGQVLVAGVCGNCEAGQALAGGSG